MRSEIPKVAGQEPEEIEEIILFCNGHGKSLQKVVGTGSNKFGKQVVQFPPPPPPIPAPYLARW